MPQVVAFIDESISGTNPDHYFVVVAAVVTSDRRHLELTTRRNRKRRVKRNYEFKASFTPPKLVKEYLKNLAQDPNLSIVAAVWESKRNEIGNTEALYRQLVARCILMVAKKHKQVDVYLDKRYTNKQGQHVLEVEIRRTLAVIQGNVVPIWQVDSQRVHEIAAADFVAWAFMQHYCNGNSEFYNLIRSKVVHMDNLSQ